MACWSSQLEDVLARSSLLWVLTLLRLYFAIGALYFKLSNLPVKRLQERPHQSGKDPIFPILLSGTDSVVRVEIMETLSLIFPLLAERFLTRVERKFVLKTRDVSEEGLTGAPQHLDLPAELLIVLLQLLDVLRRLHELTRLAYFQ